MPRRCPSSTISTSSSRPTFSSTYSTSDRSSIAQIGRFAPAVVFMCGFRTARTCCPIRRTLDRPLLRQALEEAGFSVERLWFDGYTPGAAKPIWQRGRLRRGVYRRFEDSLRRSGRNPADTTLLPHGLRQVFLRPTVVIAAARKV